MEVQQVVFEEALTHSKQTAGTGDFPVPLASTGLSTAVLSGVKCQSAQGEVCTIKNQLPANPSCRCSITRSVRHDRFVPAWIPAVYQPRGKYVLLEGLPLAVSWKDTPSV